VGWEGRAPWEFVDTCVMLFSSTLDRPKSAICEQNQSHLLAHTSYPCQAACEGVF
jgi:hypothetical protein